ncbi:MAG: Rieske 2Fe-2S domain-containing protein [Gammaproteobacteria bacterium]|nr:Rieske 2Fe-2S domain-containing protein [Gammaproteobacteria bacterium]
MAFHTVCATDQIPQGSMARHNVNGTNVLVYHLDDGFYATSARCTHMGVGLQRGKLKDNCVVCPFHRAQFDIRTGEVVKWANFPPGVQLLNFIRGEKALATYPTKVEDDQLLVEV